MRERQRERYPKLFQTLPTQALCVNANLNQLTWTLTGLYPASSLAQSPCNVRLSPCMNRGGHCPETSQWASGHVEDVAWCGAALYVAFYIFAYVQIHQCKNIHHWHVLLLHTLLGTLPRLNQTVFISYRWEHVWHGQLPAVCFMCERAFSTMTRPDSGVHKTERD